MGVELLVVPLFNLLILLDFEETGVYCGMN